MRRSKRVTRNTSAFILGTTPQQNSSPTLMKKKSCTELLPCRRVMGRATRFSSETKKTNLIPTPCFVYDVDQLFARCLFVYDDVTQLIGCIDLY
jgi:hypothetical protein